MSQGAKTCVNALKLQICPNYYFTVLHPEMDEIYYFAVLHPEMDEIYYFAVLHPEMDGQFDFVCTTNVTGTNVRKDHVKIYQVM